MDNLDTEQQQALTELVSEYNASTGESLTEEQWRSQVVLNLINERKWRNVDAKGAALIQGAKGLPDEKRLRFTQDVEVMLQQLYSES